ncbi:hypothetical protein R3F64_01250 [Halomonas sp. 5021]|uniref:hypothetical protein n=1 Tax=Halomonas sp. 5021 TaxID=3082156 RepID=UPI002FCA3C28
MAWSKPLGGFAREVEQTQNKRLRAAALQGFSGVIERSPVDEGTFRGNHRVSVGSPDNAYDEDLTDSAGDKTLSDGFQIIGQVNNPFAVIYVQNNSPYGPPLENGSSKQAPQGVYAITFNDLKEAAGRDF